MAGRVSASGCNVSASAGRFNALTLLLLVGTTFLSGYLLGTSVFQQHVQASLSRDVSGGATGRAQCDFPVVYNKPPKTGSTTIRKLMLDWANHTRRAAYPCSNLPLDNAVVIHECLPRDADPCGVLSAHLVLAPSMLQLIERRLPNFRLLTTTRYAPHRIISYFMQVHQVVVPASPSNTSAAPEMIGGGGRVDELDYDALRWYLSSMNPWRLYNYHTGDTRTGSCPLSHEEMSHIFATATRFDIVVDPNLPQHSNAILQHFNLFSIPHDTPRLNVRHSSAAVHSLPPDILKLLRNVSCVEVELHKALLLRMASLYELATGRPCIRHGPRLSLTSCLEDEERQVLNSSWIF